MAADNLRVVIKPKGIVLLGIALAVVIAGVAVPKFRANSGANAVGAAPRVGAAPDPDEASMTPGEIEEKGMIRTWNDAPGQARDWLFLGPIPARSQIRDLTNGASAQAQMDRIINTVYLPNEAKYQAKENATFKIGGESFAWTRIHGCAFDFKALYKSPKRPSSTLNNMVVYAVARIDSPQTAKRQLRFRSDDGAIIWLNGRQVFKTTKIRGVREEDKVPITLRAGHNTLLIKVGQGEGGWGMVVHLEDAPSS